MVWVLCCEVEWGVCVGVCESGGVGSEADVSGSGGWERWWVWVEEVRE